MRNAHRAAGIYRKARASGSTPKERLLAIYDAGLDAVNKRDPEKTYKILTLLTNTIDFSASPEIGIGLHRLYQYSIACLEKEEYQEIKKILTQLRASFAAENTTQHSLNRETVLK